MLKIKRIFSWLIPILLGLLIAFLINKFLLFKASVAGPSMENTLEDDQTVWVLRKAKLHRGSVVIFNAQKEDPAAQGQSKNYIKRVIGLPGDKIKARNGKVYVNHKTISQNYLTSDNRTQGTGNWTLGQLSNSKSGNTFVSGASHWIDGRSKQVPKGNYFVLGDNRGVSEDSRYYGFVKKQHVLGVAKVFPWQNNARSVNRVWKNFFNKR